MGTILKFHDLWDLVENGYVTPAVNQTFAKDAKALGFIQGAVSDIIFSRIANEETAKGAWEILQKEYMGDKTVRRMKLTSLRREFKYTRIKENESLKDYLIRLFDIVNQMKNYGEELTNQRLVQKLLICLTKSYDNIVSLIEETKDTNVISVQEVTASLRVVEQRLEMHAVDDMTTDRAFQSLNIGEKNYNTSGQSSNSQKEKKPWKRKNKKWENKGCSPAKPNTTEGTHKVACKICDKLHYGACWFKGKL
ncbi:uncharacterized protein LOC126602834 [Malus sylvestris]|uniref:uncharacterized protein LOC126602834 n=1 Tax=Malus sylvestris TaxID=3752 RepID=UPI0021ACD253|nr:uncharacterized protein LOC126602834 [Malus sylvestris]